MEIFTFKLQEDIAKKINHMIEPLHYNNKTEFIREAIREKINKIEKDLVMQTIEKFKGSAKISVDDGKLHQIRKEVAKKYANKFGIKLD